MKNVSIIGFAATLLMTAAVTSASAEDISSKKMMVKDNSDPAKRQIQLLSGDAGIAYAEAGDPATNGASVHVYSASDDDCILLPGGASWTTNGSQWKYKDDSKNLAQIADGKLLVKIKSGVAFTLSDDAPQGAINAQVQFGTGTRYCMRCDSPKKDDEKIFIDVQCAAVACDTEPTTCNPSPTTTTTTTMPALPGTVLKAMLESTNGLFNYNLTPGVAGADAACESAFAGTHACTVTDLLSAETAGDLDGIKDPSNDAVTSFWAIDPAQPGDDQCINAGNTTRWFYATVHTGAHGNRIALNNATGDLGSITTGLNCGAQTSWVGCCVD
ncbi:MAG TPA: hypothetical protein VEC57_13190 [Candidatus Limnocylindrales bacterium]|nr:hypothetical protein [Candidatus Limnocylindrales bacterium]